MFKWYLNRLKTMSLLEIPYRFKQLIQKKIESKFYAGESISSITIPETKGVLKLDEINASIYDNRISIFGKDFDFFKDELNWHQDIFSGESFAQTFSKSINIRNNQNLSAKNVWEINRLQFLIHIAINYRITNEEKYLKRFIEINESWIEENPYLLGVNWYSNIEVNLRLINWFFCWEVLQVDKLKGISEKFKEFVETKWLPSIYQHCKYSYKNPSKYSSANNHLVSEYSGLYMACSLWDFKEADKWRKYAKSGLEKEIVTQHSNGVNKEEAAEYIQFITDFFLLPYVVGSKIKDDFSENYKIKLKEILDYIHVFTDMNINFPKYGDEDDGYVLNFSEDDHFNNFQSLLVSASILFSDSNYLKKGCVFDVKNLILFQEEGKSRFEDLTKNKISSKESAFYQKEGHFIFRKSVENKEIYAHFDIAPLGFLSIAAHGHSDALSFLLHINGKPFFVDSGTYSYHTEKKWRNYFVSSKAHNTITIDDQNQAFHASDTMWLDHFKPEVISCLQEEEVECVVGTYQNKSKVQHIRSFQFNRSSDEFLIEDEIIVNDEKEHKIFMPFHLHPSIKVEEKSDNCYLLSNEVGDLVELEMDSKLKGSVIKGELNPLLGWYSDSFMQKEPIFVVFGELKIGMSIKLKTKIKVLRY